jgi:hypothetical protein
MKRILVVGGATQLSKNEAKARPKIVLNGLNPMIVSLKKQNAHFHDPGYMNLDSRLHFHDPGASCGNSTTNSKPKPHAQPNMHYIVTTENIPAILTPGKFEITYTCRSDAGVSALPVVRTVIVKMDGQVGGNRPVIKLIGE